MRRKLFSIFALVCLLVTLFALPAQARVYVRGYYRSNGTYVMPHYRSNPDGMYSNNWSSWGNYNPYTGQRGCRTLQRVQK